MCVCVHRAFLKSLCECMWCGGIVCVNLLFGVAKVEVMLKIS